MPPSPTEKEMPSHRPSKRPSGDSRSMESQAGVKSSSSKDARADAADASLRKAAPPTRISPTEIQVFGKGRLKRSSLSESASASYPTWVILNRIGARRDAFDGDGTTSAASYTSGGERILVSFVLEKPPRTSLVTLDWPQGPCPSEGSTSQPHVVGAHRNVVLLEIISPAKYRRPSVIDFFVYKASGSGVPSLTRLPLCYWKGPSNADILRPRIMGEYSTGLLSCGDDFFVVADLARASPKPSQVDLYLWCSGSNNWKLFKDVLIQDADDVPHLIWWSTDVVLPWQHYLIWVDYMRGMIFGRITHPGNDSDLQEPVLSYVPLPVDPVHGNPYDDDYGRGCPAAFRSICNTHLGIKFVNVNQHGSSFSITLWSLQSKKWTEDAKLDAAQLWGLDSQNILPKIQPEFPVVDVDNPDAISFLLNEGRYTVDPDTPTWMIKVDMKKKTLLDIHLYSMEGRSYQKMFTTARRMSEGLPFISSEMPSYLSGTPHVHT